MFYFYASWKPQKTFGLLSIAKMQKYLQLIGWKACIFLIFLIATVQISMECQKQEN